MRLSLIKSRVYTISSVYAYRKNARGASFGKEPRYLTGSVVEAGRSMGVPRPGE